MSFVEKEEAATATNNNRKPVIKRKDDINIPDEIPSDLGKRNLVDSFSVEIYNDKERYGQDIPADFFKTNIGHNVYEEKVRI